MKTVVDEIAEYLKTFGIVLNEKTIAEFKEKERQQIIEAYDLGMGHYGGANCRKDAERYYNETFS